MIPDKIVGKTEDDCFKADEDDTMGPRRDRNSFIINTEVEEGSQFPQERLWLSLEHQS